MDKPKDNETYSEEKYLEFVKERLKTFDFRAEEKLKAIDELADIIFTARKNYQKNQSK